MAYGDFKGLTRRTVSDKILDDKAHDVPKNFKYDGYQRGLVLMSINVLIHFRNSMKSLIIWLNLVAKYSDYLEKNLNVVNEYQSL